MCKVGNRKPRDTEVNTYMTLTYNGERLAPRPWCYIQNTSGKQHKVIGRPDATRRVSRGPCVTVGFTDC